MNRQKIPLLPKFAEIAKEPKSDLQTSQNKLLTPNSLIGVLFWFLIVTLFESFFSTDQREESSWEPAFGNGGGLDRPHSGCRRRAPQGDALHHQGGWQLPSALHRSGEPHPYCLTLRRWPQNQVSIRHNHTAMFVWKFSWFFVPPYSFLRLLTLLLAVT